MIQYFRQFGQSIGEPYKSWLKANYRFFSNLKNRFIRLVHPRKPSTRDDDDGVYLHIGCGEQDDSRYINVDAVPFPHVHYVQSGGELERFADGSVDLIYASHILEHISHQYTEATLEEWYRGLKPGGILRIAVPDFDRLIDIYESEDRTIESILPLLMGVQDSTFNAHRAMFNQKFLTKLLRDTGFEEVREWQPEDEELYTFDDFASHRVERGEGESGTEVREYAFSLNLEAVK